MDGTVGRLAHGVRASLRNNGQAYGYSVSITVAGALLNTEAKVPGSVHLIYFALGAIAAFSLLQALASAGFRKPLEPEPSTVTALGVSLSVVSVGTSVLAAWGCARFIGGVVARPVASFAVSAVYLTVAGLELALAERAQAASRHGGEVEKRTAEEEVEHHDDPAQE
ncbi:hypothetical protein [Streptomyces xinghaiensis]|uniref:hypothetical protein n=1 Tax=Streptomyces xinghaiensis TaxID=1038928 RepID=UPI000308FFEC|nr:hypothetical protein [Streptomyces xinghaiensis]MZE75474.1 hypothetical protein [Streptomyces sp. SID5475]